MRVNALLVLFDGGYTEVIDAGAITSAGRRIAKFHSLTRVTTKEQVDTIGAAIFAELADVQWRYRYQIEPGAGSMPYTDVPLGSSVDADDLDGTPVAQRLIAMTMTTDKVGNIVYVPEVGAPMIGAEARLRRTVSRAAPGALAGRSAAAQPIDTRAPTKVEPAEPRRVPWTGTQVYTVGMEGSRERIDGGGLIVKLEALVTGATSTDLEIELWAETAGYLGTVVVPAGTNPEETAYPSSSSDAYVGPDDRIYPLFVACPPEEIGLTLNVEWTGS